jgi:hypothetical protein
MNSTTILTAQRWPLRWLTALAAAVAAGAHLPVIAPHLIEAPYMGVLFILLTVACATLALMAVLHDAPAVYAASAVVCALAIIGYGATRIIAFPLLADDVGNWLEPLGVVSILAESVVVASSLIALRSFRTRVVTDAARHELIDTGSGTRHSG